MARIPDEVIEQLKRETNLVALIERQGHRFKPHGKDQVTRCPFHEDDTPSLVVSPDTNLWHCMGACQAGGSVIDWVMKTEGVSFRHAVELLRGDLSVFSRSIAKQGKAPVKHATKPKLISPIDPDADEGELLSRVIGFYQEALKESPDALAYLERRGLGDPKLIKSFRLGFANRTLGYRLPQKNRKAGAEIRGQLQTIGILRSSGHEHFTGSLVIPVIDERGQVREVYGRKINDHVNAGTILDTQGLRSQTEIFS